MTRLNTIISNEQGNNTVVITVVWVYNMKVVFGEHMVDVMGRLDEQEPFYPFGIHSH